MTEMEVLRVAAPCQLLWLPSILRCGMQKNKGGRPRILKKGQEWTYITIHLTKKEKQDFDELRIRKQDKLTRADLLLDMMELYEKKHKAYI